MKQAKRKAITARTREVSFRERMRKFVKRVRRGDIPQLPLQKEGGCTHDWELDGQTLHAVRWYCRRCGASQFT